MNADNLIQHIRKKNFEYFKRELSVHTDAKSLNIGQSSLIACLASLSENYYYTYIQYLVKEDFDVNRVGPDGKHALMNAVKAKNFLVIQLLVSHGGADVNYVDKEGKTPLIAAINHCFKEAITYLIRNGANVCKADLNGKTPLCYSVSCIDTSITSLLLANGAIFTINSAFLEAIAIRNARNVRYLHEMGAEINLVSVGGYTPLTKAIEAENFDVIKYLVSKGANVNGSDGKGRTPLSIAVQKQNIRVVDYLIDVGADLKHAISELEKIQNIDVNIKIYLNSLKQKNEKNKIKEEKRKIGNGGHEAAPKF